MTEKKSLWVTGASGFVGRALMKTLAESPVWIATHCDQVDILNPTDLDEVLQGQPPDAVVHLAAQSFVPESFRDPAATLHTNVLGTLNVLQSLKRARFRGAFLYVSSGEVYGKVSVEHLPVDEQHLPFPRNPYAASKLAAEMLCRQWSVTEKDWRIVIARPFNHIGPGQRPDFVVPDIARQLIRISRGEQPSITLGNTDVSRDFLDVEDVIAAYLLLLEKGQSGETYNVCSGQDVWLTDILDRLCRLVNLHPTVTQDPERMRPAEQRQMRGSNRKLIETTGWAPRIPLDESLRRVLDDWRGRA